MTTDLLNRPITAPSAVVSPSWDFVPVIFANGEDDDLPGLTAAIRNERVQYGDRIYKHGEEIIIHDKVLRLCCDSLHILGVDDKEPSDAEPGAVVVREGGRRILYEDVSVRMGDPPITFYMTDPRYVIWEI